MADLIAEIATLESQAYEAIRQAHDMEALARISQEYTGKKGALTAILKKLGTLSPEERSVVGKAANAFKEKLTTWLNSREKELEELRLSQLAETEFLDLSVTPPEFAAVASGLSSGHIHPIVQTQRRLEQIFTSMGFSIADGPQIEDDYHNFGALNFTDDHPARDMQDTFYTKNGYLLRTHTSSVQIRVLESTKPPLRIVAPGRVFRYEEVDASHEHTFYQMEGMVVDRKVSVANLLHLMQTLLSEVFGRTVTTRLRPGYFPFVEPGFELDMQCLVCNGSGCPVCKHSGWVEVLPCGLIHPNVLAAVGLDPREWQGAAFGLGLNRLVMMQHGIEDIRHFMAGKLDFLEQFPVIA